MLNKVMAVKAMGTSIETMQVDELLLTIKSKPEEMSDDEDLGMTTPTQLRYEELKHGTTEGMPAFDNSVASMKTVVNRVSAM
jgi:uncharacterized protein YqgV (UPF0045/DUF77 family)